jgi:hypothetical protein
VAAKLAGLLDETVVDGEVGWHAVGISHIAMCGWMCRSGRPDSNGRVAYDGSSLG